MIAVVGSINLDLVVTVERHPAPGETVVGGDRRELPGGKGANQAVAAARLGRAVAIVGRVGADAAGRLALSFGFAYVGVNMRGTGCSGGVFDAFSPARSADGYDVIEIVARQPWVKHGHVGMIGVSYSGFVDIFIV